MSAKNKITGKDLRIFDVVILADIIMRHFHEVVEGIASDYAYYELLEECEGYLEKPNDKEMLPYLEMTFNIERPAFKKLLRDYQKQMKEVNKYA